MKSDLPQIKFPDPSLQYRHVGLISHQPPPPRPRLYTGPGASSLGTVWNFNLPIQLFHGIDIYIHIPMRPRPTRSRQVLEGGRIERDRAEPKTTFSRQDLESDKVGHGLERARTYRQSPTDLCPSPMGPSRPTGTWPAKTPRFAYFLLFVIKIVVLKWYRPISSEALLQGQCHCHSLEPCKMPCHCSPPQFVLPPLLESKRLWCPWTPRSPLPHCKYH